MSRQITQAELRERRGAGEDLVVIDVRSVEDYAAGHVDGAIHVPLADIEADPARLPLDRPLVTVCGKGGGRSTDAAAVLAAAGATDVGWLEGGTLGWLADEKKLEGLMAKNLFILNDGPYGTERSYNALRLAGALSKREGEEVRVFLMGDAAACARSGQRVPTGYYNVEVMLRGVTRNGGLVGVCGTCMDARGLAAETLIEGASRSTLDELTTWTQWADKTLVF